MARQTLSKVEAKPLNDTCAERYFRVGNALFRKVLHHSAGDEGIIGRSAQTARHELETFQKSREIGEAPDAIHFIARERGIQHNHGFAVNRSFQM